MNHFNTPRAWLARLSMSFLILAGVCIWQVSKVRETPLTTVQNVLLIIGAIGCAVLAGIGTRMRHKPPEEDPTDRNEP